MINKIDYLLASLSEECGEVIQEVSKSLRFGLQDYNPYDSKKTINWDTLRKEVHDIMAVYRFLCYNLDVSSKIDEKLIETKLLKIDKWMQHAIDIGRLK